MIDVVDHAIAAFEVGQVLGGGHDVLHVYDSYVQIGLQSKLLVQLVPTHSPKIIALRVLEEALDEGLGVLSGGWFAWPQFLVDFLESFFFVASCIFLKRTDDGALIHSGVDDAHFADACFFESPQPRLGKRFKRAG